MIAIMRRTLAFDKGDKRDSLPYYAGMFSSKTVSLFLRSHCKVKQTEFKNKYCSVVIGCLLSIVTFTIFTGRSGIIRVDLIRFGFILSQKLTTPLAPPSISRTIWLPFHPSPPSDTRVKFLYPQIIHTPFISNE